MSDYVVIYEDGEDGWGACLPDLPGVVSHGDTVEEVAAGIRDAVALYIDGLRREGRAIPAARSVSDTVAARGRSPRRGGNVHTDP